MKNKNKVLELSSFGFTLSELLACILILAMIALVGVPACTKIIKKSREKSYRLTINNIMTSIKDNCKQEQMLKDDITYNYVFTKEGMYPKLNLKGKLPLYGSVSVDEECHISNLELSNQKYLAKYNNGDIEISRGIVTYKPGDVVYFDPISDTPCNQITFNKNDVINKKNTCYRWRVISTNDTNKHKMINIQLDHSLFTGKWAKLDTSYDYDTYYGPVGLFQTIANNITTWNRVPYLNYIYNTNNYTIYDNYSVSYGVLSCKNGECSVRGNTVSKIKARAITAEEIINISNYGVTDSSQILKWNNNSTASNDLYITIPDNVDWLIENTDNSSPNSKYYDTYDNNSTNYLTLSPSSYGSDYKSAFFRHAICIGEGSKKSGLCSTYNYYYSIRPVINIYKSLIAKHVEI